MSLYNYILEKVISYAQKKAQLSVLYSKTRIKALTSYFLMTFFIKNNFGNMNTNLCWNLIMNVTDITRNSLVPGVHSKVKYT